MEAKNQTSEAAPKVKGTSLSEKAADAVLIKIQSANDAAKVEEKPEEVVSEEQQVVDLDSLTKFKFRGKEYTPEELENERMMRKDYTKKTQELAKNKKFDENLKFDLQTVRQNPNLADVFKKTYPEKYHDLLDVVLKRDEEERDSGRQASESELSEIPKTLLDKIQKTESELEEFKQFFFEQKVQANQAIIDGIFQKNSDKYPYANTDSVLLKAESLIKMNKDNDGFEMTDVIWDRLFKLDHQEKEKRYSELYKKRVDEQLKKGEKAKDSGPGGLAPGRERKRVALEDVADIIIQDLQGR